MTEPEIAGVVETFWRERQKGVHFPSAFSGKLSLAEAYRVQLGLIARRVAAGERQVGWKVGLTAKTIQEQIGVHEPVFGCLLAEGLKESRHRFQHRALIRPGFENEVCVRLGRELAGANCDIAAARRAVECCHPALEIIETRGDFKANLALALADNAQQKAIVLGPPAQFTDDLDLAAIAVRVAINGEEVATGRGEAVLGHPLNALVWLAKALAPFGRGLSAGELVMTGSFTRQFAVRPGDRIRADFDRLGPVEAAFD